MRFEMALSFKLALFTFKTIQERKKTYPFSVYRLSGKNLFIKYIYVSVPFDEQFFTHL